MSQKTSLLFSCGRKDAEAWIMQSRRAGAELVKEHNNAHLRGEIGVFENTDGTKFLVFLAKDQNDDCCASEDAANPDSARAIGREFVQELLSVHEGGGRFEDPSKFFMGTKVWEFFTGSYNVPFRFEAKKKRKGDHEEEDSDDTSNQKEESNPVVVAPQKRPVGRPRKIVSGEQPKKRPVGRPRKIVPVQQPEKRPVGRPRKIAAQPTPPLLRFNSKRRLRGWTRSTCPRFAGRAQTLRSRGSRRRRAF